VFGGSDRGVNPGALQTTLAPRFGLACWRFPGVFVSTISGMMYKIAPFLNWLHLQRLGAPISAVPNMKKDDFRRMR
jgi:hypothetical protein